MQKTLVEMTVSPPQLVKEVQSMALNFQRLEQAVNRLEDLVGRQAAELAQLRQELANDEEEQQVLDEMAADLERVIDESEGASAGVDDRTTAEEIPETPPPTPRRPAAATRLPPRGSRGAAQPTVEPPPARQAHKPREVPRTGRPSG